MPIGSKKKYTSKQKRTAEHIKEGYLRRGNSKKKAERIAWATVNKEYGEAGTDKIKNRDPARKGAKKAQGFPAKGRHKVKIKSSRKGRAKK